MPEFREKPKAGRPKAKHSTALPPKQAARLMKEKYLQQLDQRPDGADSESSYAAEQVEGAGRWAADEVGQRVSSPQRRRKNPIKEKTRPSGEAPAGNDRPQAEAPQRRPAASSQRDEKGRSRQLGDTARQRPANLPKERTVPAVKERAAAVSHRPEQPPTIAPVARTPGGRPAPAPRTRVPGQTPPRDPTTQPSAPGGTIPFQQEQRRLHRGQSGAMPPRAPGPRPYAPQSAPGHIGNPGRPQGRTPDAGTFRTRSRTAFKTRSSRPAKPSAALPRRVKPPITKPQTVKTARQTAQRHMRRQMVERAQKAAKVTVKVAKKAAQATVRAVAALVSGLAALMGGGVLLIALVFIIAIAAVASSPFGLFFAAERNAPDTVSVAEAVAQVNRDYNAKLEELQAGDHDSIVIHGQASDWPDVLAVFASRYAGAGDGVDVATLDTDRVSKLNAVFWDMTVITSEVETIDHPGDGEDDPGWTEYILHITITPKTAGDMAAAYGFTAYQVSALDELLADRAALSSLAGSLTITSADVRAVLDALPDGLSPERRKAVETALQLVGKVGYFWGGKSYVIGWDSRWGQLAKVTSPGNTTTGTYRPYGLDCTGFLDWTLRNAGLPSDGHWYVGTNLTQVAEADAQPGDMALYPDASHIGIVVGRDETGRLLVCHCSFSQNDVVVTGFSATGFTVVGRPDIYGD